jgi:uncharacterized protein (DUF934 family)
MNATMHFILPEQALPAHARPLTPTDDVLALAAQITPLQAVVLQFPKWTDGRAYSQAVLLRNRLRFAGDIIAAGEVLVDMLPLLRRCGFTAVQLAAGQSQTAAERALGYFDGHYQTAARPLSALPAATVAGV